MPRITDKGHPVDGTGGEAKDLSEEPGPKERYKKAKGKMEKVGGKALEGPRGGCNCHGYTFDRGRSEISESDVLEKILPDNYTKVERTKARICDVVVYGVDNGVPDHSGLVVEIGPNGEPSKIVSKWGPTGGVFEHPPSDYGTGEDKVNGWDVYRRNTDPDGLQPLRDAYDKAVKDHGASSEEARKKALELCQAKNALPDAK